jgi:hypothetical protein
MTAYGPTVPTGFIPFTGFTPTLGTVDAATPSTTGLVQFNGNTQRDGILSRELFQGPQRIWRRLYLTLLQNNVGTNATENRTRVQAQPATFAPTDYGGLVPIETIALINRNTTALDLTNVVAGLSRTPVPASYPPDVGGNGGGGKLGF